MEENKPTESVRKRIDVKKPARGRIDTQQSPSVSSSIIVLE